MFLKGLKITFIKHRKLWLIAVILHGILCIKLINLNLPPAMESKLKCKKIPNEKITVLIKDICILYMECG